MLRCRLSVLKLWHFRRALLPSAWLLYSLVAFVAIPSSLLAQSVLITDCQGFTRAARSVPSGTPTSVRVELATVPAEGSGELVLTNIATNETIRQSVTGSTIVFDSVAPGAYTITAAGTDLSLAAVTIGSGVGFGAAAVAVGGAVALGGSATAVAVDQADSSSSSGRSPGDGGSGPAPGGGGSGPAPGGGGGAPDPGSPTPIPTASAVPTASATPPPSTGGGSGSGGGSDNPPAAAPTPEDCDCDPDERPNELDEDEFFADDAPRKPTKGVPTTKAADDCLNGNVATPLSPFM